MKYLIPLDIFECDIPGDPVGNANLMKQNPRIPDTISVKKFSDDWKSKCKKCKKKVKKIMK